MPAQERTFAFEDIAVVVSIIRKTIIESRDNDVISDTVFRLFPAECCEYSAWLVGAYLQTVNLASTVCVGAPKISRKKTRPNGRHCWLETKNVIVDITADQFLTTKIPIIVEPKVRYYGSTWHYRYFHVEDERSIELFWMEQKDDFSQAMQFLYSNITKQLLLYDILQRNMAQLQQLQ